MVASTLSIKRIKHLVVYGIFARSGAKIGCQKVARYLANQN